jgi:hypothetical protein
VTALAISAADLRWAAGRLSSQADHGISLAARVRAMTPPPDGWSGLAALQAGHARESWARSLGVVVDPLEELASWVSSFAEEVDAAQHDIRTWRERHQAWAAETARMEVLLATADDQVRPVLMRRRDELLALARTAEQQIDATESQVREAAGVLAERLDGLWSDPASTVLQEVHQLRGAVVQAGRAGVTLLASGHVLRLAVHYARSADLAVRAALLDDARLAARWVMTGASAGRAVSRFAVVKTPVLVWLTAVPDVMTGGGYGGRRGMTTRLLAGAALPASVGVFVPHPLAIGASLAVLGAYSLWSAGNLLYDHRRVPARVGSELHRAGRSGAARLTGVVRSAREAADDTLAWARDRLDDGLGLLGKEVNSAADVVGAPVAAPPPAVEQPRLPAVPAQQIVPVGPLAVPLDVPSHRSLELSPGPAAPRLPVDLGPRLWSATS